MYTITFVRNQYCVHCNGKLLGSFATLQEAQKYIDRNKEIDKRLPQGRLNGEDNGEKG